MSYSARVFKILIASPSDVQEEREIAVKTIQEWNDLNSSERQVVLLPLRWETHSAPEYGKRPQEVINRQVVDHCDLLVGVFWTRIGSPTGLADSGTIEEIERVASQGKPIMLYFSQAKQDPDKIDVDQLSKLRKFKEKTFPRGLIESFSNQIEFRDKLAKQLEIQIRELIGDITGSESENQSVRSVTDVQFHFASPETGEDLGETIKLETIFFDVVDFETIPDYEEKEKKKSKKKPDDGEEKTDNDLISSYKSNLRILDDKNKDYYRDIVNYVIQQNLYRPIRFWIKNAGGIGARDVYIEIRVISDDNSLSILNLSKFKNKPSRRGGLFSISYSNTLFDVSETDEEQANNNIDETRRASFELRSLQPQRIRRPKIRWLFGAKESCSVTIQARIYADTLAEPITRILKIDLVVKKIAVKSQDIIKEYLADEQNQD